MRKPIISVGIDIGTSQIRVVIAEQSADPHQPPRILGTGCATSRGVKHGYVVTVADAARALKSALSQAAGAANLPIRKALVSVGGEGLDEAFSRGEAVIERGDSVITQRDVQKALEASEAAIPPSVLQNRRIVHRVPLRWTVDGARVLGKNPAGMKGMRLAVESLFITCPSQHIDNAVSAVEATGVEVEDVVASPIAASFVTLAKKDKRVGCVLCDVGEETLSATIFEDEGPISLKMFPTGTADIAADIAMGVKVPLEEAEQLRAGALSATVSKKKIDDIIDKRLAAMFKQVAAHLKKIGKDELLPAGVILTGGGSAIDSVADVVQHVVRLPCRTASLMVGELGKQKLRDGSWSVAYGLTVWDLSNRTDSGGTAPEGDSIWRVLRELFNKAFTFLKRFLP